MAPETDEEGEIVGWFEDTPEGFGRVACRCPVADRTQRRGACRRRPGCDVRLRSRG